MRYVCLVVLVYALVIGTASAVTIERELPKPDVTPDSWMYGFKRVFEKIDLLLTFDELKKAEKYIKYAELRLAEAREIAKKGKADVVEDLAKEYEENIKKQM